MTLWVFGQSGHLARALAASKDVTCFGRSDIDWMESPGLGFEKILMSNSISGVINASGYTNVEQAEEDCENAYALNAFAPEAMAIACRARSIPFIHISTDYVFSGKALTPYKETHPTQPLNVYGQSKLHGEIKVLDAGGTVLRTSWVYDVTARNFFTIMSARRSGTVKVVKDQIGRPTYAPHLAEACLSVLAHLKDTPQHAGLYHVTGTGEPVSWADFAKAIFKSLDAKTRVIRIPSSAYPTRAERPKYSVLNTDKVQAVFGVTLPDWQDGLSQAAGLWQARPDQGNKDRGNQERFSDETA